MYSIIHRFASAPPALIEALNLLQKAKPRAERAGSTVASRSESITKQEEGTLFLTRLPRPIVCLPALSDSAYVRITDQKPPPKELLDALAGFLPAKPQAPKPTVLVKPEPRNDRNNVAVAGLRAKRNADDPVDNNRREGLSILLYLPQFIGLSTGTHIIYLQKFVLTRN